MKLDVCFLQTWTCVTAWSYRVQDAIIHAPNASHQNAGWSVDVTGSMFMNR